METETADTDNGVNESEAPKAVRGRTKKVATPESDPVVYAEVMCRLEGLKPGMMMHPMDDATLDALYYRQSGSTAKGAEIPPMEVTARSRMYRDETGRIVIPTQNLMACLIEAGRRIPYAGKMMLSNAEGTKVTGIISIDEEFVPLEPNPEPNQDDPDTWTWVVDKRRGQMDNGTTVCIVRPKFREWWIDVAFTVDLEGEPIGMDKIRKLFDIAGKSVGINSFRPQRKGSFGRFRVKEWMTQTFTAKQLAEREAQAK